MKHSMAKMLLIAPVAAAAWAGPFDGTWIGDVSSTSITGKPDTYTVQNGVFNCEACYPGLKIPADGKPHAVTGHSYYDSAAVTIVSPQVIQVSTTLAGKKAYDRTLTVSADGKTLNEELVDYSGTKPQQAKFVGKRVAAGPDGAHALSGSWQADAKAAQLTAEMLTVTYQETDNGLKWSTPTGQSYDAKFDGKEVAVAGDPGKTMVSLEKLGPNKIRETDKRKGQISDVVTSEVSSDGKSLHVVDEMRLQGQKMTYTAKKQ